MVFTKIYSQRSVRVFSVDLDGVNLLTFAIVFPVPGGSAEHNLCSRPALIWFFEIKETRARLPKIACKVGRDESARHSTGTPVAPGG